MQELEQFLDSHKRTVFLFSGGKDAMLCLDLLKPYLDDIMVMWVNTGAVFPEITALMDELKTKIPRFLELQTEQNLERDGYPVDVLPIAYTEFAQNHSTTKPIKLRDYISCCSQNIWMPYFNKCKELNVTGVIRGQRAADLNKASSNYHDGIHFLNLIDDWTDDAVIQHMATNHPHMIERLSMSHSSLDCWNCTAYCSDGEDRAKYIAKHYPEQHAFVQQKLGQIVDATMSEMYNINKILKVH